MKLRTRIILAMTLLMVISLLVIGAVTIFFFQSQNEVYHQERLERKERAIKTEMTYFTKEVEMQQGEDVVIKEFEEEILRLSDVHRLEINIFNTKGEMLVSARPGEIHSEYMDRRVPEVAFKQLDEKDRIVIPESRDGHSYLSDYTVLKNANSKPIAILNIPYRNEDSVNQTDLTEFLGSIGITYIFLFLAAIALTILLSNSITRNLTVLGDKMQSVDLNAPNETIPWTNNDEIGSLIAAYNEMLSKLSESRDLLAKTEREGAWREMARQVAHEIKNPLTPIKLSIQHLQATSNFESEEWQSKFKTTMGMIIQQIESLNKIASEFSDFAKMHEGHRERVNVKSAIDNIVTLFSDTPVKIIIESIASDLYVMIDPDALMRVLSNMIKNAKQALIESEDPRITVRALEENGQVVIEIEDNGPGISSDIQTKIFQPNFTTKTSGTGLGLAICQQIIESANGKISIASAQPAVFRITLPSASE